MLEFFLNPMTSLLKTVCEKGKEKAAENLLEYADETIDRVELTAKIKEQMERYHNDVVLDSMESENLDYEELNHYIIDHLFRDVGACFNLPEKRQREQAKRSLIHSAYSYAKASRLEQKKLVSHYIQIFMQMVEHHYLQKVENKDLFLMGKTVDEIEKLLKEYCSQNQNTIVDSIHYHQSFAEYIDGIELPHNNNRAFHYRNNLIRFQGRKQELAALYKFLEDDRSLLWMAVTGDAGSGKSKLLYHFLQEISCLPEWKAIWLRRNACIQCNQFTEWNYPCNLVFVIDYAGIAAEEIGAWMERLENSRYRPEKIRFVLLERETIHKNREMELEPIWYQNLKGNRIRSECIERFLYQSSSESAFLELSGLSDEDLAQIISDYALAKGKSIDNATQEWMIEKAHEMDKKNDSPRPLIVLLAADAMLEGKQPTEKWDILGLVEHMVGKFKEHWENVLCAGEEERFLALEEMILFSTCVGGWEVGKKLPDPLADSSTKLLKMDADLLETLICAVNEAELYDGKLQPLEPDLIGEFYVLDYWRRKKYDTEYLKKLNHVLWETPSEFEIFLNRCIENYGTTKRFQYIFKDGMNILQPENKNELSLWVFAMLLVNLFNKQSLEERIETIARLEQLTQGYPHNEEIVLEYAKGLFNLSNKQPLEERIETIARLEQLTQGYPHNEEIVLEYARGLFNLSCDQPLEERIETIAKLEQLTQTYLHNEEIVLTYAKGLVNLSTKQPLEERIETIAKLEQLTQTYLHNEEIVLTYAKGLVNLSTKQPLEERIETIAKLEQLTQIYLHNEEFVLTYAKGLFNLSIDLSEEAAGKIQIQLAELFEKHPHVEFLFLSLFS